MTGDDCSFRFTDDSGYLVCRRFFQRAQASERSDQFPPRCRADSWYILQATGRLFRPFQDRMVADRKAVGLIADPLE
jgi:hypothetical protein